MGQVDLNSFEWLTYSQNYESLEGSKEDLNTPDEDICRIWKDVMDEKVGIDILSYCKLMLEGENISPLRNMEDPVFKKLVNLEDFLMVQGDVNLRANEIDDYLGKGFAHKPKVRSKIKKDLPIKKKTIRKWSKLEEETLRTLALQVFARNEKNTISEEQMDQIRHSLKAIGSSRSDLACRAKLAKLLHPERSQLYKERERKAFEERRKLDALSTPD